MKAFFSVVVAVAVVATANAASILEKHPIDWYNCAGKADGNYPHPWRCTAFISCSGGVASERECAACHVDPVRCPDGQTVYDPSVDACLWADETQCSAGTPPTNQTSTPTTEPSTERVTNATAPPTQGTTPGGGTTPDPEEGDPCDPHKCKTFGDCQTYYTCNNTTGRWVKKQCPDYLFWNPDGSGQVHGGNCGTWAKLPSYVQDKYSKDPKCMACFWEADECSQTYRYQAPNEPTRTVQHLKCEDNLVFVVEAQTCVWCDEVPKKSGGFCCPPVPRPLSTQI